MTRMSAGLKSNPDNADDIFRFFGPHTASSVVPVNDKERQ